MTNHINYMQQAVALAKQGLFSTHPNPRVGCVLVNNDVVVGTGWHQQTGGPHAEIHALNEAGEQANGAICYVTLEPCNHLGRTPPCAVALVLAGIKHVVIGSRDPNPLVSGQGIALLKSMGIEIMVLDDPDATQLNRGFFKRMNVQKPWVRLKLAMSLDGRTAMASGESQWITGIEARRDVQYWRARSDAIVTGIGTVLADDPSLTVRPNELPEAYQQLYTGTMPLRVVMDSTLALSPQAKMLTLEGQVLCITTSKHDSAKAAQLEAMGAQVDVVAANLDGRPDLENTLGLLAERSLNEVWVEAGATLAGSFLRAGLVDELIIYMAPKLLGSDARGLVNLPGLSRLADAISLEITEVVPIGKDWRIHAIPKLKRDGE